MGLASDLERIARKRSEDLEKVARASLARVTNQIIQKTPVDRGILKNSWQSALGSKPSSKFENDPDPSGSFAIQWSMQVSYSLNAGDTMYFVNNLPYASAIEYGHSMQAPAGMLRATLTQWQSIVREEVVKYS